MFSIAQSIAEGGISGVPPNSFIATFGNAQTAGNCNVIFVAMEFANSTLVSCVDTVGNPYELVDFVYGTSPEISGAVYVAFNIGAASAGANTVTVTWSGGVGSPEVYALEIGGGVGAVDVHTTATFNPTTTPSISDTTLAATTLLLAYCYCDGSGVVNDSQGSGWSQDASSISGYGSQVQYRNVSSAGPYTASCTTSDNQSVMVFVSLKASGTPTYGNAIFFDM